jgi:hypothetical protein
MKTLLQAIGISVAVLVGLLVLSPFAMWCIGLDYLGDKWRKMQGEAG